MQDALSAAVLVVVEPKRLLAGVALRCRVGLVAANLLEASTVGSTELHEDSAVTLAQDARGRLPMVAATRGSPGRLAVGRHRIAPTGAVVIGRPKWYLEDTKTVSFLYRAVNRRARHGK